MAQDSKHLRWSLRQFGYSDSAIRAAWPGWWSDDAEGSPAAQAELRFSLARKFGLDPRQLVKDDQPRFVWTDFARFKHLTAESTSEQNVIGAYGASLARALIGAVKVVRSIVGTPASSLRADILASQQFVKLSDLLALCWGVGLPIIHLRIFPLAVKRMCAMSVQLSPSEAAVLLGKDADYPAPIAYYVAHELGHIALGHIKPDSGAVVDLALPLEEGEPGDLEEEEADRFALELLTGRPTVTVETRTPSYTARELARVVLDAGPQLKIEPGTLALCFGYSMKDWPRAMAAMKFIYAAPKPVWREVNSIAEQQIDWSAISHDMGDFARSVMAGAADD